MRNNFSHDFRTWILISCAMFYVEGILFSQVLESSGAEAMLPNSMFWVCNEFSVKNGSLGPK